MKKKAFNSKLQFKKTEVCKLDTVKGAGTHYAHCEPVKFSDWCTFVCIEDK